MPPIVIGLIIIVVLAALAFNYLLARRREQDLERLAAEAGMEFSDQDIYGLVGKLSDAKGFNEGDDQEASNVLHGAWRGRETFAFDYQYSTGSGKDRHTYEFSACMLPLELDFPALLIRPEGLFDKVAEFFGADDIQFESDEFSRKFVVKAFNKKFASDVCNPQMMEFLLANRGASIQIVDGMLVIHESSRWSAEEFRGAMDFCAEFLALIPDFVWKEYRERAGTGG